MQPADCANTSSRVSHLQQLRHWCVWVCAQVRITSVSKVRNYISYAVALLEEKGHSSVILKAMGSAINKAVVIGEQQLLLSPSAWGTPPQRQCFCCEARLRLPLGFALRQSCSPPAAAAAVGKQPTRLHSISSWRSVSTPATC